MITTEIPTAAELDAEWDDDDDECFTHVVRPCDPDTGLCGDHVPGSEYTEDDDPGPWCPECVAIDRAGDAEHLAGCVTCRTTTEPWWR